MAAELAPADPSVLFRCASLLFALGQSEDSRNLANRARGLATEDFPLLIDLIHQAGRLALDKGNYMDGEKVLRIAFEEDPAGIGHGRVLAECYLQQGRLDDALNTLSRAQESIPTDRALAELESRIRAKRRDADT